MSNGEQHTINSDKLEEQTDIRFLEEIDKIILSKSIQYIGPLRYYPDRNFITEEICEDSKSHNSAQLWALLGKRDTLKKELNDWLSNKDKLKSHYEIVYNENAETILFKDKRTQTLVTHKDLGLGVSQVLPVLIASYFGRKQTIIIEQPELHLHPAVQAELGDEIIKSYKNGNNDFFIETHSEYLLLRIMRRMRYASSKRQQRDESLDITRDDILILYVDQDEDRVFIREIQLSDDGKLLQSWPGGFFEEGFKERFE
jgi:predicted ATPase